LLDDYSWNRNLKFPAITVTSIIIMDSIKEEYFNPEMDKDRSKHLWSMLEQPEYLFVKESVNFLRQYMNSQE